jgi:hypothetical protein
LSLKAVHSRVFEHKALNGLLGEADVGPGPEEEGTASLLEVPNGSHRDCRMGLKIVKDNAPH